MLIGVLSDTHLRGGRVLPNHVWDNLNGVDMILHAGDVLVNELLTDLSAIAPVYGVRGNCDGWEINLPDQRIVECETIKIGLIHGHYGYGRNTPERAFNSFKDLKVEAIVFGHSHQPHLEWKDGILLLNPGSPTDRRREPKHSLGFIKIAEKKIDAWHLFF